ncbi:rubredoxin [Chitinophaga arvensicola]|uniref:Rubredoxin n=1 Tax=Chitinophaga arvensicola TaxID=29529 RepID=A0A1I0SBF1_9BACT|nr:rubredoxin [Chitinophaga arvensicola]SEW54066.1 Rubredoxin [Chitinophaga arvensicola]
MAKHIHTLPINFTGGIVSPGYLLELLKTAAAAQATQVRFGLRQQLLIDIPDKNLAAFKSSCAAQQLRIADSPNIMSSYAAAGIFIQDSWLSEGIYKDVFNLFDYTPALKINICDSRQTFVPLFTGHINWISSASVHYWHLYIRLPDSQQLYAWPELIYTNNIAAVSKSVEQHINAGTTPETIYTLVKKENNYITRPLDKEPDLPAFHLPYYEGFNKHENSYWLGIYRRDEDFPLAFLKEVCAICLETRIGQLYATPWKSLIIKNIDPAHRKLWDYVLGKYGINVRHAANELNWQVEDNCEDGLILKRHVIRYFDTADVRTYGLCFSVRVNKPASLFGTVVIRKQENKHGSKLKYMQRYDILHTAGYNANSAQLVIYRESVSKEHLGPYIVALCKTFYEQHSEVNVLQHYVKEQQSLATAATPVRRIHQCPDCFTVYDDTVGDAGQQVAAGTLFQDLPASYCCSVCAAPLSTFNEIPEGVLQPDTTTAF